VALEQMVDRLLEDHLHARKLAEGLSKITGLVLDEGTAKNNMVFLMISDKVNYSAMQISNLLEKKGVRVGIVGEKRFRLVTHYWIKDEDINKTIEAFGMIFN
jgi:threonine aldolase